MVSVAFHYYASKIELSPDVDKKQLNTKAPPVPADCDHTTCKGNCWRDYPQSRFPNWTPSQVRRCKIHDAIWNYDRKKPCVIYKLDVNKHGIFNDAGQIKMDMLDDEATLEKEWKRMKDDNVRFFFVFLLLWRLKVITPLCSKIRM
jgi:hypothetical protein